MNYIDILNDSRVIERYNKNDEISKDIFNHGLKHIKNVCNIMNEICDVLKIEPDVKDALMIAAALHDIGLPEGRENHGKKAVQYITNNINDLIDDNKYYNEILTAISCHSDVDGADDTLFTVLLQFSDKVDFSKNRLENNYREKFDYFFTEAVEAVNFIYDDINFGIDIITNGCDDFEDKYLSLEFFSKVTLVVKCLAKKLNRAPVVKNNGVVMSRVNFNK